MLRGESLHGKKKINDPEKIHGLYLLNDSVYRASDDSFRWDLKESVEYSKLCRRVSSELEERTLAMTAMGKDILRR